MTRKYPSPALIASLFCTILAVNVADGQICFRQFLPANTVQYGGRRSGHCSYPIGGVMPNAGIYIRSFDLCCRRPGAGGWGMQHSCEPCGMIRGQLGQWTSWTRCSRSCGLGRQSRRRVCSTGVCVGVSGSDLLQTRPCSWRSCCPVDGGWAPWSKSTGCSVSCGQGYEYRIRSCSRPKQKCGGRACVGTGKQYKDCFVNCASWAEWITQAPCSVTCGNGTEFRQRVCDRPFGGFCPGPFEQHVPCYAGECPRNGGWCNWMQWTSCSSTCSEFSGIRKRVRICTCPFPEDGGKQCEGSDRNAEQCSGKAACSVNGGWSGWASWSACTATPCSVETGWRNRTRTCTDPAPLLYGDQCEGDAAEEQSCMNMADCKVEGRYESWSGWSSCAPSCGKCMKRVRTRRCVSPFNDPQAWGVEAITGLPELLCFDRRMKQQEKCKVVSCGDKEDESCDEEANEQDESN